MYILLRKGLYCAGYSPMSEKQKDEMRMRVKNVVVFLLVLSVLIGTVCFIPR